MKCTHVAIFALAIGGLSACASQPAQDHYYSLVLASDGAPARSEHAATTARLIVGPIQLARYLEQPGIAIQTGMNEIQTAHHHFWAEPLDEAIAKVLVRDISRRTTSIAAEREAGRWTGEGDCRLRLELDKFHATANSQIMTSGRYWIYGNENDKQARAREFNIVGTLTADGYAQAVRQLRTSLESLAGEVVEQLVNRGACAANT